MKWNKQLIYRSFLPYYDILVKQIINYYQQDLVLLICCWLDGGISKCELTDDCKILTE